MALRIANPAVVGKIDRLAQLTGLTKTAAVEKAVRAGKPVARLTPIAPAAGTRSGVRFGGIKPARLKLAPDFHVPLTDDDLLSP